MNGKPMRMFSSLSVTLINGFLVTCTLAWGTLGNVELLLSLVLRFKFGIVARGEAGINGWDWHSLVSVR